MSKFTFVLTGARSFPPTIAHRDKQSGWKVPLPSSLFKNRLDDQGRVTFWDTQSVHDAIGDGTTQSVRSTERLLEKADAV